MAPGEAAHPLSPRWSGMLRLTSGELSVSRLDEIVEVDLPPTILIGDIGQVAPIGSKARLEDTDIRTPSEQATRGKPGQGSVQFEIGQVEEGAVPRHVGLIPSDKGDLRTPVAPAWPHVEVVPLDQPLWPLLALTIHHCNAVSTLVGMDEE